MENYTDFVDWLRLVDALMATVVVGIIFARTYRFWSLYDNQQKSLVVSFITYVIAIAYTSFELYSQNATIGFRSYIVLIANVIAFAALTFNRKPGLMTIKEFEIKAYLEELDAKKDPSLR